MPVEAGRPRCIIQLTGRRTSHCSGARNSVNVIRETRMPDALRARPLNAGVSRLVVSMEDTTYTRSELLVAAGEFPQRGPLCPHCDKRIPQFADLSEQDERRVRELIRSGRPLMAMAELRQATDCPLLWARLWVEHQGRPQRIYGVTPPCPYCGSPLRTQLAKQCRFCRRDWHDPENVVVLGVG